MAAPVLGMLGRLLVGAGRKVGAKMVSGGASKKDGVAGAAVDIFQTVRSLFGGKARGENAQQEDSQDSQEGISQALLKSVGEKVQPESRREDGFQQGAAGETGVQGRDGATGGPGGRGRDGAQGDVPLHELLKQPNAFGDVLAAGAAGKSQSKLYELQQKARVDREALANQQASVEETERATETMKQFRNVVAGTAGAAIPLVLGLQRLGGAALAGQEGLAEYNGTIAGAMAALEIGRINRDIRFGGGVAGSVSGLASSQNRLEESLLPAQTVGQNVWNVALSDLNNNLAAIAETATMSAGIAGQIANSLDIPVPTNKQRLELERKLMLGGWGVAYDYMFPKDLAEDKDKDKEETKWGGVDNVSAWNTMRDLTREDEPTYKRKSKPKKGK